jgi:hypothetical protein
MIRPRSRSGEKDRGSREYTAREADAVLALVRAHVGPDAAIPLRVIEQATQLEARTVRKILNDADGEAFVVSYDDNLLFLAAVAEEAEGYTRKLEAQARTMWTRIAKRKRFEATLPRRQGLMFAADAGPNGQAAPHPPRPGFSYF